MNIKRNSLVAGLAVFLLIGAGSANVLNSFGTVSGTADVKPALEFVEVYYESNVSEQDSGEYVLLQANSEVDLGDWELKNGDDFSGEYSEGQIALVDNTTSDAVFSASDDVEIVNAGNLATQGLSDAEDFELVYSPKDVTVRTESYNETEHEHDCSDSEALDFSSDSCEEATLEVEEVSSNE